MYIILISAVAAVGLFLGMLALVELGRRLGTRQIARDPDKGQAGAGVIDGAVFALFGLLVAFTFSGAASRFDSRRQLVVEEANDIGTAYLRTDLLPAETQPALRESFRKYLDSRLETYRIARRRSGSAGDGHEHKAANRDMDAGGGRMPR
jgi:hypothetical protein